jgi:hypothetical protein
MMRRWRIGVEASGRGGVTASPGEAEPTADFDFRWESIGLTREGVSQFQPEYV